MSEPIKHIVTQYDIDTNPDLGLALGEEVTLAKKIAKSGPTKGIIVLSEELEGESDIPMEETTPLPAGATYKGQEIVTDIVTVDVQGVPFQEFTVSTGETYKISAIEAGRDIIIRSK